MAQILLLKKVRTTFWLLHGMLLTWLLPIIPENGTHPIAEDDKP